MYIKKLSIIFILTLIAPVFVFAFSSKTFSGRIIKTSESNVVCNGGTGPITLSGSRKPSLPLFIPSSAKKYGRKFVSSGRNILGRYFVSVDTTSCYTPGEPPVPYPVYSVDFYGV